MVIWLARERYGFVPWVVGFLIATWVSTLLLGRGTSGSPEAGRTPGLGAEVASYLTRTLYQETLFFLIPFYAYSTVLGSANVVFPALLVALAILSCLDLVFDRILREHPAFAMIFFATVVFAAVNLLLPLIAGTRPALSLRIAAFVAVGTAMPLVARTGLRRTGERIAVGLVAVGVPALAFFLPQTVPAVPLRLDRAVFASDVDPATLEPVREVSDGVRADEVGDRLAIVVGVFAPGELPTRVRLSWYRDGDLVRTTRDIAITAHGSGFRVWDGVPPDGATVEPGRWRVVLRTAAGGIFGVARIEVSGGAAG